jgi:hypothetical protein
MNFLIITGTVNCTQEFIETEEGQEKIEWGLEGLTQCQERVLTNWALYKSKVGDAICVNGSTIIRLTTFQVPEIIVEEDKLTYREMLRRLKTLEGNNDPRLDNQVIVYTPSSDEYFAVTAACSSPDQSVLDSHQPILKIIE